jgi:hypothetical protein
MPTFEQEWPFDIVAVLNDGEITLPPEIVGVSPVIRAHAVEEEERMQAKSMSKLLIKIPVTVRDLRTVEQYVRHANQTDYSPPQTMDLATLITVAELVVDLDIPGVADLVTSDISQVLESEIEEGRNLRDNPWLDLCRLASKTNDKRFYGSIAWCFWNATRATRSLTEAIWASQTGETAYKETGYRRLWTDGLYLCAAWGPFGQNPVAPTLSRDIAYTQGILVTMMNKLASPRLCEVHEPQVCVPGDARDKCVERWEAVWRQAHQVALEKLHEEYEGTNLGGVNRDVLRMLHLITLALQDITQDIMQWGPLQICDVKKLHTSNGWLLAYQTTIRTIIESPVPDDFHFSLRNPRPAEASRWSRRPYNECT